MKRILFLLFLFALSINVILAQVATINIVTPNSNGLSNNQVADFDVNTDGTILNNSASGGTAQLGNTAVTGNSNITAGSEADLILFQVTGSSGSDLDGAIEVFGEEAGLIIANPNGIACDGCGFINTSKVDLVTGTANFSGDDLTGFSIDGSSTLTVGGSGFLSDAVADELNLVSRYLRINAQAKANTTLRGLAGNETYDHTTNIITSNTTETSGPHSIWISGDLEANYIELISTEISSSHGIVNFGADISADRLKIDSNGLFRNQDGGGVFGDINISGLLEVINAENFINNSNITAEILSITTDEFFNNDNGSTQLGNIVVTDTFSLSTPNASYTNTGTVSSDSLSLIIGGDFAHYSTTLNNFTFNNLAITTEGDFTSYANIDIAGDLRIQVSGEASLDDNASIKARNLFFSAYDLWSQAGITITENATFEIENDFKNGFKLDGTDYDGGNISAGSFNVTTGNNFINRNNATIDADNFNVTTGGHFRNLDSATINANNFNVTTGTYFYNGWYATINADNFNVTTTGNFTNEYGGDIMVDSFNVTAGTYFSNQNGATIEADSFNFTTGTYFTNQSSSTIEVDSFNVTTEKDFANQNGATISANSFNVTAGKDFYYDGDVDFELAANDSLVVLGSASFNVDNFYNYGKIDVANDFNVTAEYYFYNRDGATINANDFNVTAEYYFYNRDGATINANSFNVTAGYDFYNYYSTISADNFNVTVGDDFYNSYSTISADNFNVTTRQFYNRYSSTISADSLNISYNSFDNKGIITDGITYYFGNVFIENVNNLSIVPDGTTLTDAIQSSSGIDIINIARPDSNGLSNNSYSDFNVLSSGLVFNNSSSAVSSSLAGTIAGNPNYTASDSASLILNQITSNNQSYLGGILEVAGDSAGIIIANPNGIFCDTCSFANTDKVDLITGTANFNTAGVIYDYTTTNNDIYIYKANIFVKDFNAIAGDDFFNYVSTISTDNFNVTVGIYGYFYNRDGATINANDFNVTARYFYNWDGATINANSFNVAAGNDFYNRDGATISADNFNVTAREDFYNRDSATISADNFNVTAREDFYNRDSAIINANIFNVTTYGDFYNIDSATISADNFNVTLTFGDVNHFYNNTNATINANDFTVTIEDGDIAAAFSNDNNATINADNFNVTLTNDFYSEFVNDNNATINADNFNVTAGDYFYNGDSAAISADNFNVTAYDFYNWDGAIINANDFNVTGSFSNQDSATISANDFNVTGRFSNEDNATISANDFNVTGTYFFNRNSATINADSFNVTAGDDFLNSDGATISADSFNVTAGDDFYNYVNATINADSFNVTTDNFYNYDNATISADTVTIEVTNFNDDIDNTGTVSSDSLNFILTDDFTRSSTSFSDFTFNNLGIITDGSFTNEADLTVNNFNVTAGGSFFNDYSTIDANDFNVTAGYDFYNRYGATISTDNFNVTTGYDFYNRYGATISTDNFNVTTGYDFYNQYGATISVNDFNVTARDDFYNIESATIDANDFNVTAGDDFYNDKTINVDNFNVTAADSFVNGGAINADSFNVTAGIFVNYKSTISANDFNVTVEDYFDNYYNATINADNFNVTAVGEFQNSNYGDIIVNNFNVTAGGFSNYRTATIDANDFNVTAGNNFYNSWYSTIDANNFNVTTDNYTQRGAIDVAGDLRIQASGEASLDDYASIKARNLFFSAYKIYNQADITITENATFDIENDFFNGFDLDGTDYNGGDIIADSFNVTAGNNFINRNNATISADSFNVTTDNYTQSGAIDIAGDLRIQVSGEASLDDNASIKARNLFFSAYDLWSQADITITENATFDIENDFLNGFDLDGTDYNGGDIIADSFNVTAGNNFINRNNATISADSFNVTTGTYFINEYTSMINADNFNVITGTYFSNRNVGTINADSFTVTTEKDFANQSSSTINANDFNVTVGDDFRNSTTINADSVTIEVTNFDDDIDNTATVSSDSLNFILTDSFTRSSTSFSGFNNFNNLGIITDGDFTNKADLTVNNFNVTAGTYFSNKYASTINANSFIVTTGTYFSNGYAGATINADNFNVTAGDDFINRDGATINADNFNVTAGDSFSNEDNATINADDFNVTAAGNFTNQSSRAYRASQISADNFTVTAGGSFFNDYSIINANSLNVTATGDFTNQSATIDANDFNVTAGKNFYYDGDVDFELAANDSLVVLGSAFFNVDDFYNYGKIDVANDFNVTANYRFYNRDGATINADNFNVTADSFYNENSAIINADDFNVTLTGYYGEFYNYDSATINADTFNVTLTGYYGEFYNYDSATINADTFNVTLTGYYGEFANRDSATINANSFNVTGSFYNENSAIINADSFNVTGSFYNENSAIINADSFNVTGSFSNWNGAINANTFALSVEGDFDYSSDYLNNGNIDANNQYFTIRNGNFTNSTSIALIGNLGITANNFINTSGTITADTFALSVEGDFDYANDFQNNGNIDATTLNFQVGGNFSYDDASNDFVWNAQNSLTVLGTASITADNFTNYGDITADTLALSVEGDFDYANDFQNNGNIDATTLNFQVGGNFSYDDASNDFVWNAQNSLTVLGSASVTADSFTNLGYIDIANSFNVTAGADFFNRDSATISADDFNVTADYFYNRDSATINTDNFNVTVVDDFYNYVNATINADNFSVTAGDKFFNFSDSTINADNFNVTVADFFANFVATISADNFNVTAGGDFYNIDSATIDANDFNVTADNFFNTEASVEDGNISADNFSLSVKGDFDYANDFQNNGNIDATALNFQVGGDFSYDDSANDFTWGANDTLTVLGSASVVADSFNNSGTINVSNSSFDITATDFTNSGTISANTTLNTTVSSTANNSFTNTGGVLNATAFALSVAGDFDYVADFNGTITTNAFNLNVGGDFSNNDANNDFTWGANDTLTVLGTASVVADSFSNSGTINVINSFDITAAADFDNSGTINVSNSSFDITATDFTNSETISANSFNATVETFINEANATITAGECNIVYTTYTDNGTITCLDSVTGDAMVIDIALPNANGLSNNSYETFYIPSNGIVLNNSDSAGTSQLAGDISANTKYNSGDAASLILAQITGNDISLLFGALEVFGAEAGVIIANPSGITCNACSFINASRVDLVTGSNYNVATDSFDSIANTNIGLIDNGFDASSVGILNIQAGSFTNTGGLKANTFNLSVAGDFDYTNRGTIATNALNLNVGGDFSNNDANNDFTWGANDTLTVLGTASVVADSFSNSGTIAVSNSSFDITATDFTNSGTISANTTLNTTVSSTTSNSFTNTGGVLNSDTFALSVAGDFDYVADFNGTITTNTFNLNVGGNFSNNDANNDFTWGANDTLTVLGSAFVTTDSFTNLGYIDIANSFNVTAGADFVTAGADFFNQYSATISADSFNVTVGYNFYNRDGATINADNFNVTAGDSFSNEDNATINADTVTIEVTNFADDIDNSATISSASLNFILTDDFTRSSTSFNGFTNFNNLGIITDGSFYNEVDLTVNNLNVTAGNDFVNNGGNISADNFNVTAEDDFYNRNSATINADNFNVTVGDDFFNQSNATINADSFNVTAGDDFLNSDGATINADNFNVTTGASFQNIDSATISADNFNVTATGDFTNQSSAIDAGIVLITTASNFNNSSSINADILDILLNDVTGSFTNTGSASADTFTLSVAGDFDYVADFDGTITTNAFNLNVGGDFSNNDSANDFVWGANDTLTVLGSASVVADSFTNLGYIDIANSFNVTAEEDFFNRDSATISADSFNATANYFFNEANATITANECNIISTTFSSDLGTITCNDEDEIEVIDIARPDANGLSNNSYTDFNILNSGIVLNNSDSAGTSQLAGDISANTNYNSGDAASLILAQITGNDISLLEGALEVFGAEAGVIIANPSGITCNGCSFINASRVDLVTGTANFSGDDLTGFSIDGSSTLTVGGSGFLSDAVADELNLTSGRYTQSGTINITGDLNIQISGEASLDNNASIQSRNLFFSAYDIYNQADITITDNATFDIENDFKNGFDLDGTDYNGGDIIADSFNVTAGGNFVNWDNATISADNFNVTAHGFYNLYSAEINANDFNVIADNRFLNYDSATINADSFNVTAGYSFDNSATINANDFNVAAGDAFYNSNSATINANDFNVTAARDFFNYGFSTIDAGSFNVTVGDGFYNSAMINANDFNVAAGDAFSNSAMINANDFNVAAGDAFYNSNSATINANDFNVTAARDFYNYETINANNFNVTAGYDFNNYETINADNFNVTTGTFSNSSNSTIDANNFNVSAADDFLNYAIINANNFNVTAGRDFANEDNATISADNFNVTAGRDFSNEDNATISADNFNVTATGDFTNQSSAIDAGIVLITTASNFNNSSSINADILDILLNDVTGSFTNTGSASADTFTLSVAGDFDYVADYLNGTITTNAFNLNVGGDFSNNDSANDFVWNANDSLTVLGSADITTDSFTNLGYIDIANSFNVTAEEDFFNRDSATISADSFNATANYFFNEANATITANECDIVATSYTDNGTITCNDEDEIEVIDIARPDANGLSNNSYTGFNILNSGIVFNNSDSAGTSQLAGSISANTNYNSGDAASLILAQITGNDISLLEGALEVFGAEAGVIIANPSGITCNGCSFINASRVDLVTGSNYNSSTDSFNDIANTNIALIDNGFDASSVGILNIQAGSFNNTGGLKANTFNLSVIGDFDYTEKGIINATGFNLNVGGDFSNNDSANDLDWGANDSLTVLGSADITADSFNNSGNINADNFNVTATDFTNSGTISADTVSLSVAGDFDYVADFNGTITTNALNLNVGGDFSNNDAANDLDWGANDSLTVLGSADITADSFNNSGNINADNFNVTATDFTNSGTISANTTLNTTVSSTVSGSFNNTGGVLNATAFALSVAGDFDYVADFNGTITTNTINLNVGGDFSNNDLANDFTWGANDTLTVLGSADITTDSFNNSGNINADSFNVTATDFTNSGTISANTTLNTTVSSTANNSFTNTGGVLNATAFALSVAGDFDYVADFNGTITTNTINLNVGGDFSNNDLANDFTWGANDSLTVLGSADITTDSFNNSGNINADNFNVTATDFTNSGTISANTTLNTTVSSTVSGSFNNTGGVLNATAFALSVAGDFDYVADFNGTITTNTINLNVGGDFSNNDLANDFTWGANDSLTVLGSADITTDSFNNSGNINADNFNVTATDFTNSGTISANTTLNTTVSSTVSGSFNNTGGVLNATAFALSVAGDFDYVADYLNNGTITTNAFNLNVGGDFSNNDAANDLDWGANDALTVSGSADITADSFNNSGNINADNFNITATDFTNSGTISANTTLNTTVSSTVSGSFDNTGGVLNATAFALSVAGDFDYVADFNGTITTNTINLNVGGDFSNNDLANDFTWGANDSLTVLGSADITTDSFNNSGNINADNFNVTATDFTNSGTISANTTLNTTVSSTVSGSFNNTGGVLNATAFALSVAGDFDYVADYLNNGTITTNAFNLNVGGDFSNNDAANDLDWGANDALTVSGSASVTTDSFNNSGNINADNFNVTATDFTNSGTISANTTLNTTVSSTESGSFNNTGGVVSADTVSLSVAGDFDYVADFDGTITTNAFNLNVGGDFSNNDLANDLDWGANDSLTVLGNADITADSYTQNGAIDVAGVLTINVESDFDYVADFDGTIDFNSINLNVGGDFSNNDASSDFVWNANDSLTVLGSADITADSYTQNGAIDVAGVLTINVESDFDYVADFDGTIDFNSINLNVGGDFSNNDASNDFNWGANDSLTVSGSASVVADSFNNSGNITVNSFDITATDFTNSGTISANTTLNTTVSSTVSGSFNNTEGVVSADIFNLNVAGDFDDTKKGTITTNSFNLSVGGNFSYDDASNDFVWNAQNSLTVLGNAFVTAASFNNSGIITVTNNGFDITATDFNNSGTISANTTLNTTVSSTVSGSFNNTGGVVSADTVSLSVAGDFDYVADFDGTIDFNSINLNVGGDFSNNDSANDFTWGENDILTVSGNADITADSYTQNGAIDVAGVLTINVESDFDYVADFDGTIDFNSINLNVGGDFSNNDLANDFVWNANDILTVSGNADITTDSFNNSGNINANSFDITATDFNNSGTISANTTLNTTVSGTESGSFNNTGGVVSADTVSLSVAGDFDYVADFDGTIDFNSINLNVGGDFSNNDASSDFVWNANDSLTVLGSADITADSYTQNGAIDVAGVLTINVESDFDYVADFDGTIDFNSINLNVGGDFSNNDASNDFVWNASDSLVVLGSADITTNNFANDGNIFADTFALSVAGDFDYTKKGTITTNSFNLNVGGDFSNNDLANDFTWGENDALTVLGSADITTDSFNNSGNINADNFNVTATDFTNSGTISANTTLNTTVSSTVSGSFNNTGGVVSADTVSLSVAGDFDYVADFDGTIDFNSINLNVGGDFSNNDLANDFTWGENDSLTVLGSADITTDSFNNSGNINANSFDITATDFTNSGTISANTTLNTTVSSTVSGSFNNTGGVLNSDTFALSVAGDFDYVADYLNNGTITTNAFNLNVGGDFSNNDSANDFTWGANDSLTVLGSANIVADSYTQNGAIDVAGVLTINVESDFDYVADFDGTIDFNSINLNVGGDFSNNDLANDFVWNANDILTISGNADITTDSFNNSGNINANSFDVTATDFNNSGTISANTTLNTTVSSTANNSFTNTGGVLNATAFALSVAGDFDYVADYLNNGTITADTINLNVGGDFSNNDSANDFNWGANDNLTVLGSADITTDSFNNSGNINANSFDITATDFTNSGTISANTTLNTTVSSTVSGSFNNTGGVVNADTVSLSVVGDFDYVADYLNNGTITTNAFNLNVGGDFSNNDANNDFVWNASDSLTVSGSADITADSYTQNGAIDVAGVLTINVESDFDYVADFDGTIDFNSINLNVGGDFSNNDSANDFVWNANDSLTVLGSASVTTDSFNNSGNINADNFNVTATDFTNSGTISANTTLNTTVSSTASGSFNNTGGVVNADTFNLNVAGNFDDTKKGNINANYFNLTAGGYFSNNDASDDFVLGENDSLSILGDFTIATNNYIQFGTIVVDGVLNIDADRNFVNHGGITTESLNITTGYTAINQGSIVSDSLAITANDFFRNLTGGDVDVATLNITAGGKVTNTANITVGTLNIIANNDSSRTNDTTAFYVANRGNITATTLNIAAVDNFYNRGNITATNFNITRAKAIFFLNKEIDSFYAAGHIYNGGNISLSGDASFTADGGIIENYGNIDLGDFNLDITANRFINQAGANVTANTLNLDVNSLIQHGFINAVINHQ